MDTTCSMFGLEERAWPVAGINYQVYVVIALLLKQWLLGTHQGAVSGKHLDYFFGEYTFRFNRRTSGSRGMIFYRIMKQVVMTVSSPCWQIVDGDHKM